MRPPLRNIFGFDRVFAYQLLVHLAFFGWGVFTLIRQPDLHTLAWAYTIAPIMVWVGYWMCYRDLKRRAGVLLSAGGEAVLAAATVSFANHLLYVPSQTGLGFMVMVALVVCMLARLFRDVSYVVKGNLK